MATHTITTAVNSDTLTLGAGAFDTYNINGGYLTVDQDTRYGTGSNTTACFGNIAMSATLGGTIEFNATMVRLIPYDGGSGNVPASNTTIAGTTGSGKLITVYSALNAAPTAAGAAMPAAGFIKIKQWNSSTYGDNETLTGITATVNGTDTAGWIEIPGGETLTATVNRLNTFKVRGTWYVLGTTTGTSSTTYQIPSNGNTVYFPGVWVETGSSTNIYEFYPCAGTMTALAANIATDAVRGKACFITTAGLVRFQHDGTNSTGGYLPPSGRRVRVPNVFFMTSAGSPGVNAVPHATLATRMDFTTTGGGVIDIDTAAVNWYCSFNQAYSVTLSNCAMMTQLLVSEIAAPITWSNVHTGQHIDGTAETQLGLSMALCFAGGTITGSTWTSATATASGRYVVSMTDCDGFVFSTSRVFSFVKSANATTGSMTLIRVSNCSWSSLLFGSAGRIFMTTCTDVTFTTSSYYDHPATTTGTAIPMFAWDIGTNCANLTFDGLDFGGLTMCQSYSGVLNIGAAGCKNIKLRNLGTASTPLDMGGAYVLDAAWSRTTTVMTITKTAHGLKANDIIACNIVSDVTPKAVTTTTATLWTVASAPTADTFTVTVANSGATSGTISYYPTMAGTLVVLVASAAANTVKVQRCYTPHFRTGIMTGDNSSKNIQVDNVWGTEWGVQLVPELNCAIRGILSTPVLTAQTSCYGTHFIDFFTAGMPANVAAVSWSRATTTATITSTAHGLRTGVLINVTVTSDGAAIVLGQKTITATTSNAFTFTCLNAGAASGTLTFAPLHSRIAIQMNESTADTVDQYTEDAGTPAFTSAGGLYMPVIGDQVTFVSPAKSANYLLGHTAFPIAEAVMAGGTIGNYDIAYAIDKNDGAGYGSFKNLFYPRAGGGGSISSTNVTMTDTTGVAAGDYVWGTNIAPNAKVSSVTNGTTVVVDIANIGTVSGVLRFNQLPSETITDASVGFKLKVRIKTSTTNATAITSLYMFTTHTPTSRGYQYPLDRINLVITPLAAGSEVRAYATGTSTEYDGVESSTGDSHTLSIPPNTALDIVVQCYSPPKTPVRLVNRSFPAEQSLDPGQRTDLNFSNP